MGWGAGRNEGTAPAPQASDQLVDGSAKAAKVYSPVFDDDGQALPREKILNGGAAAGARLASWSGASTEFAMTDYASLITGRNKY